MHENTQVTLGVFSKKDDQTIQVRNLAEKIIVEDNWEKRKDILEDVYKLEEVQVMITHAFDRIIKFRVWQVLDFLPDNGRNIVFKLYLIA